MRLRRTTISSTILLICMTMSCHLFAQTIQKDVLTGGYIQVRYTSDKDEIDEFKIRRARLKFSGNLADNVCFLLLLDAVTTPILWKAHIDITYAPWASLRIGQFKTPFSHEYLTSSSKLSTINRSQVVSKLASKYDIGLQFSGTYSLFKYAVGIFNGSGKNSTDENDRKDFVGMITFLPMKEVELGLSHYKGKSGTFQQKKDRTGAYLAFSHGPISLNGEYIYARDATLKRDGGYAQFAYKILPNFQGLVRYDAFNPDKDHPGNRSNTIIVGLNWFQYKMVKLQVNYLYRDNGKNSDAIMGQFQSTF